ncbi:MAG: hypothetical protein IKE04_05520 [Oscillospiraceae bacterium]|nr:hypothetical protein [Oscillospiraceae bacterium]
MEKAQKIRVQKEADRLQLAAILIANGYTVWLGKEPKQPGSKIMVPVVYYTENGGTAK